MSQFYILTIPAFPVPVNVCRIPPPPSSSVIFPCTNKKSMVFQTNKYVSPPDWRIPFRIS